MNIYNKEKKSINDYTYKDKLSFLCEFDWNYFRKNNFIEYIDKLESSIKEIDLTKKEQKMIDEKTIELLNENLSIEYGELAFKFRKKKFKWLKVKDLDLEDYSLYWGEKNDNDKFVYIANGCLNESKFNHIASEFSAGKELFNIDISDVEGLKPTEIKELSDRLGISSRKLSKIVLMEKDEKLLFDLAKEGELILLNQNINNFVDKNFIEGNKFILNNKGNKLYFEVESEFRQYIGETLIRDYNYTANKVIGNIFKDIYDFSKNKEYYLNEEIKISQTNLPFESFEEMKLVEQINKKAKIINFNF